MEGKTDLGRTIECSLAERLLQDAKERKVWSTTGVELGDFGRVDSASENVRTKFNPQGCDHRKGGAPTDAVYWWPGHLDTWTP